MNNPKAFPVIIGSGENPNTNEKYFYANEGMDLRDYFAAKAMQTILGHPDYHIPILDEDVEEDRNGSLIKSNNQYYTISYMDSQRRFRTITSYESRVARESYKIADAMLIAREKKEERGMKKKII